MQCVYGCVSKDSKNTCPSVVLVHYFTHSRRRERERERERDREREYEVQCCWRKACYEVYYPRLFACGESQLSTLAKSLGTSLVV